MRLFKSRRGLVCDECDAIHEGLAMAAGFDAPDAWVQAPSEVRREGQLGRDQCLVPWDGRVFTFIRGHIALPIEDRPGEVFAWSVWSTMAPEDMERVGEVWYEESRAELEPMPDRLGNLMAGYRESTLGLKLWIQHRSPGEVPLFTFQEDVDHELADEQRRGIEWHRVAELNQMLGV